MIRESPKWTDIAIVILTVGIVFAAAVQTVIFKKQWKEMSDAGKQTDQLIRLYGNQVEGIKDLAKEERRYADAAEKTLNATLSSDRAWIGVEFNVPPFDSSNAPGTIRVSAINTGRSSGIVTKFLTQEYVYDRFPREPFYMPLQTRASRALLIPGSHSEGHFPTSTFDAPTVQSILSGRLTLYVYSTVQYTNVRTGTRHVTHACVYYVPTIKEFQACPSYNDAN